MIVGSNGLNRLSVQVLQEQFFAHFHVLALVESSQEFLKPSIIKPSRQKKTTFCIGPNDFGDNPGLGDKDHAIPTQADVNLCALFCQLT